VKRWCAPSTCPAVQVLEAYGPKRFAGMLSNAGLPLILPAGRSRIYR
jgi:membrane carboxypeptidase/penicillin-binding protein PbpC